MHDKIKKKFDNYCEQVSYTDSMAIGLSPRMINMEVIFYLQQASLAVIEVTHWPFKRALAVAVVHVLLVNFTGAH